MIPAVTIFCEDIRNEVGGSASIIGVLPDNVGVTSMPGMMPKLGIYTRVSMPVENQPQPMQVVLRKPDGSEDILGEFTKDFVQNACADARGRGNPIAGFLATALATPFPLAATGRYLAILRVGGDEQITGSINFEVGGQDAPSRAATV